MASVINNGTLDTNSGQPKRPAAKMPTQRPQVPYRQAISASVRLGERNDWPIGPVNGTTRRGLQGSIQEKRGSSRDDGLVYDRCGDCDKLRKLPGKCNLQDGQIQSAPASLVRPATYSYLDITSPVRSKRNASQNDQGKQPGQATQLDGVVHSGAGSINSKRCSFPRIGTGPMLHYFGGNGGSCSKGNGQEMPRDDNDCYMDPKMTPAFPELQQPDPVLWQRAAAYRMNSTPSNKATQKKIVRNRKPKTADAPEDCAASVRSGRAGSSVFRRESAIEPLAYPEDYEGVLEDEEADEQESALTLSATSGGAEDAMYQCACRRLGVVPVAGLGRQLVTESVLLKNRKIGPKGARACATVLVNNIDVRKLDLEGNDLGSEGTIYVAEMLKENCTITELILKENFLETEGVKSLCEVLKDYGRIKVLDISGNNLQDKDAKYIGSMLEENRSIRELYLAHNAFSECAGEYIGPSLAINDALEMLDLSWNHLRLNGAVALLMGLKENNSISTLSLAWNGLHVEGCKAMSELLVAASALTYLDLSCNRINQLSLKYLMDGLKRNTSISVLKLGYNPISTEGAGLILKTIEARGEDLPLRELDLSDVCVDASFIQSLKSIRRKRLLAVKHGMIMKNDDLGLRPQSNPFSFDDPMTVLMEFMRIRNLRLIDLFACLDKDGNKSLSRDEFRDGLLSVNIPLSTHALNDLIDKLDTDGDGEVDFSELLEGQKQHKKKIARLLMSRSNDPHISSGVDVDLSRVNAKIRALMALTSLSARSRHRQASQSGAGIVGDVLSLRNKLRSTSSSADDATVGENGGVSPHTPTKTGSRKASNAGDYFDQYVSAARPGASSSDQSSVSSISDV